MKIKSILASALTVCMLGACSDKEGDYDGSVITDGTVAYVSVAIATETTTKAPSDEDDGANESDLKSIYLFTFDDNGNLLGIPGTNDYYASILTSVSDEPDAQKVAAKSTQLLVIANPGQELKDKFPTFGSGTTFSDINAAITGIQVSEIIDPNLSSITKGFTMINSGTETGLNPGQKITNPLIDITGKVKTVTEGTPESAAKLAAENDRVDVKIERLASKLELTAGANISRPTDSYFQFLNWNVDGLNSTFYPYAEKTILAVGHTIGGSYIKNFYTEDPNFESGTGVDFATVDNVTCVPVLPHGTSWLNSGDKTYCVENTMTADEQRFGHATRIVVKGTYYPDDTWTVGSDWFSFAGTDYKDLATLKAAYNQVGATNLQAACNKMFDLIDAYITANNILGFTATDFSSLEVGDLALIPNNLGGEVTKDGKNPVVRWYQGGLNYYYYEIRHDDSDEATNTIMGFGKYGVVRNNWYQMTLTSVSGPGTPWYPDVDNPGPGDPDPTDPIDDQAGYLGIKIEVAPWIIWTRDIGI